MKATISITKGGPGSGHHGHKGRIGKVGGSVPDRGNPKIVELLDNLRDNARYSLMTFEDSEEWGIVQRTGYYTEEALAKLQNDTEMVVEGSSILMRRNSQTFWKYIYADGKFKNQFQTGTSGGLLDKTFREQVEYDVFGVPRTAEAELRPLYGYMSDSIRLDNVGYYGDMVIEFDKDKIANRTTFTGYDSLNNHRNDFGDGMRPYPFAFVDNPKWQAMIDYQGGEINTSWPSLNVREEYIEVQIHGGLNLSDVKRIFLKSEATGIPDATRRFAATTGKLLGYPSVEVVFVDDFNQYVQEAVDNRVQI